MAAADEPSGERVRVDRWLWAIRLFKSRAEATNSCRAGHVQINGGRAKPASTVSVGDRVDVRVHGKDERILVKSFLDGQQIMTTWLPG